MKLITVVGARPQFVKAAVLSREIQMVGGIEDIIVHTGQHFDENMSEIFFTEMEIPDPKYNLGISGFTHGAMTGRMLEAIETLLLSEKPDYLIVYGDTNSTLAAALAAKKIGVKIVHIEAGVRNLDENMPEEINRYVVDRLAELNFCCTQLGVENLEKEGFSSGNIASKVFNCGDVMYDAALYYEGKSDRTSKILDQLELTPGQFISSTVHRASNTDSKESLINIVESMNRINEDLTVVMPVHPRTRQKFEDFGLKPQFRIIDPIGYFDMIQLVKNSRFVITDSGGLVREAYFYRKPSFILLEKPLWPELVHGGYCVNSITTLDAILKTYQRLLTLDPDFTRERLYGDGRAGTKILATITNDFENAQQ